MMIEAQLLQQQVKQGKQEQQKKQEIRQSCRVFNSPHSILDISGQDKQVHLTLYRLGKCMHEEKSYSDVLKAFIELEVNKHEDYAKRLARISYDRLWQ